MEKRDIIVIGASAGGFDPLRRLMAQLPASLEAAIFIVWHISPTAQGILPKMLSSVTDRLIGNAVDGELIQPSRVYVAPPDHHLMVEENVVRVTHGPKENRFRPAIDPLFRSAALTYGRRVIGIILSGGLDDGTAGLWTIKQHGGITLVQDPADAEIPSMPESALRHVPIDFTLPARQMAAVLVQLTGEPLSPMTPPTTQPASVDSQTALEVQIATRNNSATMAIFSFGELSPFTCPECHGVLTRLREGSLTRFRCHTGHAYSVDTLLAAVSEVIEDDLYRTLRSLDESMMLLNHLGDHYADANQPKLAALYFKKAQDARSQADLLHTIVLHRQPLSPDTLRQQANDTPDNPTTQADRH